MLFKDITILDGELNVKEHQYVGIREGRIDCILDHMPEETYGLIYEGRGRLLMPGFFNCHAHTPMTLMRGYGENMTLSHWLNERIFPFEAQLTGEDVYWGMLLGIAESLRFGVVSSTDMYNFCAEMAEALIESGMKGNIARHIVAFSDDDLERLSCFKEASAFRGRYHGAAEGRVIADAALHAEYTSTPKVARQLAEYAIDVGARMQVHISETRTETDGCIERHGKSPVHYLAGLGLFDAPTTAAHCVWLMPEDFDLMREKNVTVASCPVSNLKLASGVCDGPKLMEKGVALTIGTDSVASNNSLNFLEEMKFFSLVHKGVKYDPTIITPKETLYAATAGGAIAQGRTDCGRLIEGYKADLIVLDIDKPNMHPVHNLLNNIVYSACGGDVRLTMVDGNVLYRDGAYTTIDLERIIFEANRCTENVLKRL